MEIEYVFAATHQMMLLAACEVFIFQGSDCELIFLVLINGKDERTSWGTIEVRIQAFILCE